MARAPYDLGDLNLDCMTEDDLRAVAVELRRMAHYADSKLLAMRQRLDGDITRALYTEAQCERIYKQMPDNWRW
jgi:hypothetical protein